MFARRSSFDPARPSRRTFVKGLAIGGAAASAIPAASGIGRVVGHRVRPSHRRDPRGRHATGGGASHVVLGRQNLRFRERRRVLSQLPQLDTGAYRMTRRLILAVFAALVALPLQTFAHPGHEHKVLGTVTMAAADHVMVKDRDDKEVTVYLTRETKILKDKKPMKVEDIRTGLRVVITAVTVKENNVEKMVAKQIELGAARVTR